VNVSDLHPKMLFLLPWLDDWWLRNFGYEVIITSACDGQHKTGSRHYSGCAVDCRTWTSAQSGEQVNDAHRAELSDLLRSDLDRAFPGAYHLFAHSTHFHVAFKPADRAITWSTLI